MAEHRTTGTTLEHDHRVIDEHLERFAASLTEGEVEAAALRAGAAALRHHIWVEEEHHFPPLRAAGLLGPVLVMLKEHGQIWDLLDRLVDELTTGRQPAQLLATFGALREVLEAHNVKEERILYPAGDAQLDDEAARRVLEAFSSGQAPEGWTAQMAQR